MFLFHDDLGNSIASRNATVEQWGKGGCGLRIVLYCTFILYSDKVEHAVTIRWHGG